MLDQIHVCLCVPVTSSDISVCVCIQHALATAMDLTAGATAGAMAMHTVTPPLATVCALLASLDTLACRVGVLLGYLRVMNSIQSICQLERDASRQHTSGQVQCICVYMTSK